MAIKHKQIFNTLHCNVIKFVSNSEDILQKNNIKQTYIYQCKVALDLKKFENGKLKC